MLRLVISVSWLSIWGVLFAGELTDKLELPAERTELALQATITDIARAGDRLVAVGDFGAVLYSDDDGGTWRQGAVPVQSMLTAVDFVDETHGWAVGHDAVILYSGDGGITWSRQLDGRQTGPLLLEAAVEWEADVQARLDEAADDASDDLLAELDAAQIAVADAEREVEVGPNRPFLDVIFTDRNHGLAIGAFGYFFETADGGKTWTVAAARVPNLEALHLYSITGPDPAIRLMVGEFGLALRSQDSGLHWEPIDLGYEGSLFTVFSDGDDVWIGGLRGNLFFSDDGGAAFREVPLDVEASILGGVALGDGEAIIVGTGGLLISVRDEGASHSARDSGGRGSLAAVVPTGDGSLVLAGEVGIVRLAADDSPMPVIYAAEQGERAEP